ncbi:MAG: 2,3,4,5-tetrahydropyridine-2,6-dicarboxylate N-succinyltransferase [Bradymonadales bacterium]|jgi:2,3,4,5-tetrahydropyridine-2-carboxylate N-succinyltransferase
MNEKTLQRLEELELQIQEHIDKTKEQTQADALFGEFVALLESGEARAAYQIDGVWQSATVVKRLILWGFKLGKLQTSSAASLQFCDKHNLIARTRDLAAKNIRIVPGGSSVRAGAYLGKSTTIMPPAFVNIGAYIDDMTMIDSHVTVGSCAQIGKNCHLSAAVQIGGVLEPINAIPTIIEDNCFIGGNSGIFEGTQVHKGAIIAAGTILTRATRLYDLVKERIISAHNGVLHVPENAVVVPGSRPIKTAFAAEHGLQAYAPIIMKYRDEKSDASTTLEQLLR